MFGQHGTFLVIDSVSIEVYRHILLLQLDQLFLCSLYFALLLLLGSFLALLRFYIICGSHSLMISDALFLELSQILVVQIVTYQGCL